MPGLRGDRGRVARSGEAGLSETLPAPANDGDGRETVAVAWTPPGGLMHGHVVLHISPAGPMVRLSVDAARDLARMLELGADQASGRAG